MTRACLDTNVLISGLISPSGTPHKILQALRKREFLLIISKDILSEVEKVLKYPRIKKNYRLTDDQIKRFLKILRKHSYKTQSHSLNLKVVEDDPEDDKILARHPKSKRVRVRLKNAGF